MASKNLRREKVLKQIRKDIANGEPQKVYDLLRKNPTDVIGERYYKCEKCGNIFEQDYIESRNRYTSWKTCIKCRQKAAYSELKQKEKDEMEVYSSTLEYTPFESQKKVHEAFETHRFLVIAAGNRWGKDRFTTMAGIIYFIECLNENRHIERPDLVPSVYWWIIAPTEKMAKQNWNELKKFFPKKWVVAVSDSTFTMQTVAGGIIEVRSAYDPESLVGVGLDLVTITEGARIRDIETVWANIEARLSSPGRGRLIDRNGHKYGMGKAIINSSPIGKNGFYKLWTWGQKNHADYSSDWVSFQFPWTDNPVNEELANKEVKTKYGVVKYEEDLKRRIGERLYRQNYMADFLASDGTVFKDFEEKCVKNIFSSELNYNKTQRKREVEQWKEVIPFREYRISWDIATGSANGDEPIVLIRDMQTNNIVRAFSFRNKNYEKQYSEIAYWSKFYNNAPVVFSKTGHTPAVGQLEKLGVTEIVVTEQGGRKTEYIQNLEKAVQNNDVHVLFDGSDEIRTLIFEMNDYTEKNGKYSNNECAHDDYVSALYLLYYDYGMQSVNISYAGLLDCI